MFQLTQNPAALFQGNARRFSPLDKFAFRHAHDKKVQFQNAVILKFGYFVFKDCKTNHDDLL